METQLKPVVVLPFHDPDGLLFTQAMKRDTQAIASCAAILPAFPGNRLPPFD